MSLILLSYSIFNYSVQCEVRDGRELTSLKSRKGHWGRWTGDELNVCNHVCVSHYLVCSGVID